MSNRVANGADVVVKDLLFRYGERNKPDSAFEVSIPSLRFSAGTISVLMGENGSGKTTILKLLAGLIEPDHGFLGIMGGKKLREDCTLVHQDPYLLGGTIQRNVSFGLGGRGLRAPDRIRRVKQSLGAVGLEGFEKRRTDRLSGGERQRVALARALAIEPIVLLLDEPTAGVDDPGVAKLEAIFEEIAQNGTTIIIASHDASFSYRTAQSLHRIEGGHPAPTEINVIRGRVSRSDGQFTYFATNDSEIRCSETVGDYRALVLPFNEVILSPKRIESSAQNQFEGIVERVVPEGNRSRVDIECGFRVSSIVTGYSIEKLRIKTGVRLYVIFKASAVRLY